MAKQPHETIIIGAGIAGLTAALYAARKRMRYKLLSSDFGGQFMVSGEVLNYPGIIKTTGAALSTIMKKQMEFNKVEVKLETVEEIKKRNKNFEVITSQSKYLTKTVILTTGSKPRKIKVPGEDKFANQGVTYCSVCDGPLFSKMPVAIIGGGDSAMEAADFMKEIASQIYLLVKDEKLKDHEYLQEKVLQNKKVKVFFGAETTEILRDKFVSGIKFKQKGKEKELKVKGVLIEIGRVPNTEIFKGLVKLDEHNHIKIDCQTQTSLPGIFAAGDCASSHEYQYVIAAGQGCMALLRAARYLARNQKT